MRFIRAQRRLGERQGETSGVAGVGGDSGGCFSSGLRGVSLGRAMLLVVGIPGGFSEREVTSPCLELRVAKK